MKITFFGAAGGVTGSKHFLSLGSDKVLLDCGFFQGRRLDSYQANSNLPEQLKETTAVILSHAHADHCCSLPLLVKNGYRGPIYTTPATADISELIMLDSAKIQSGDYNFLKKIGVKNLLPPIYNDDDIEKTVKLFNSLDYHQEEKISKDTSFKFYDAGHILGSAITLIKTKKKNIAYTGDLGNLALPILPDPEKITEEVEVLIIESTYGNRDHVPVSDAYDFIEKVIKKAIINNSRIIVPAFALGRTQELIYILHKLYKDKKIPSIPVFIDSPLSNSITNVFEKYFNDFDNESWQDFLKNGDSPFSAKHLKYIQTVDESKELNYKKGPLIIIASSGMLEGGRVLHHLKNNIEDPNSIILLTGYQASNTLGRKLESGVKSVKIYGDDFEVRSEILKLDQLSAHADKNGLLRYIKSIKGLKKVFLVHGEQEETMSLAEAIKLENKKIKVIIPKLGETFNL